MQMYLYRCGGYLHTYAKNRWPDFDRKGTIRSRPQNLLIHYKGVRIPPPKPPPSDVFRSGSIYVQTSSFASIHRSQFVRFPNGR